MKKDSVGAWVLFIVGVPVSFGVSWLMALAGEPRSVWLMCEILSLCEAIK